MKETNKKEFLIEEKKSKPEKKLSIEEQLLLEKKRRIKRYMLSVITNIVIAGICFALAMVWQMRFDLIGYANVFSLTFLLVFFGAWIMFVYNKNILSPFIHGLKVFGLMFVGKRTKESYYEYSLRITENPIPKFVYIPTFIVALALLIPAIILTILAS